MNRRTFLCGLTTAIFGAPFAVEAQPAGTVAAHVWPLHASAMSTGLSMPAYVDGDGPVLVMVGGGTVGAAGFAPHAKQLAPARRVVRLQSLNIHFAEEGHVLPDDYSVTTESRAMRTALDALGLRDPLDVVGWSYGGLIALDFALNNPHRVRALILVEPPAFWVVGREEARDEGMREMLGILRSFSTRSEITEEQLEHFRCALGNCPPGRSIREDPRWPTWMQERGRLRGLAAIAAHHDDPARLGTFQRPVLIVTGSTTVPFHRRINEVLAQRLPQVRRAGLPGGHASPLTARDEFVKVLSDFLAGRP